MRQIWTAFQQTPIGGGEEECDIIRESQCPTHPSPTFVPLSTDNLRPPRCVCVRVCVCGALSASAAAPITSWGTSELRTPRNALISAN